MRSAPRFLTGASLPATGSLYGSGPDKTASGAQPAQPAWQFESPNISGVRVEGVESKVSALRVVPDLQFRNWVESAATVGRNC